MSIERNKIVAIILAGGDSKRLSEYSLPKQLMKINNKYVISYCLDIYQNLKIIDSIILVINDNFRSLFEIIIDKGQYTKVDRVVSGGKFRQESIYNGISSIKSCDIVVIQNGVSIFTPPELIRKCIKKAKTYKAVSAFVREIYSSFEFKDNRIKNTLDRKYIGHVRDPQVFDFQLLLNLHIKARKEHRKPFTNDIILANHYGHDVYLVESHLKNFKITSDLDIKLAHILL